MTARVWVLLGLMATLALGYVIFFTEWLRPAPIELASQVRFSIQPPRYGRTPSKKPVAPGKPVPTNQVVRVDPLERVGLPEKGGIDPAPGGAANVTFSLDGIYQLTALRVEDVPADGTPPHVVWQLKGKSRPLNSLLYSRDPEGMKPLGGTNVAEPLSPGVPYRLIVEAGRRRGTNRFTTVPMAPQG